MPPLNCGWSSDWIFWVAWNLILALGNAFLYSALASLAYFVPKPPSKMTTSSGAVSFTPSGFFADFLPFLALSPPPLSLLAQADRKLIVGNGDQAECGGPLDQIATAEALTVVLGGSGSHAQVLAFSRTQAVNRP